MRWSMCGEGKACLGGTLGKVNPVCIVHQQEKEKRKGWECQGSRDGCLPPARPAARLCHQS